MEETITKNNKIELLSQFVDIQSNIAKVDASIYNKKASRIVASKVSDMQECIEENANEYGIKLEHTTNTSKITSAMEANIIRNYTLALEKIVKQYDIKYKNILETILKLQNLDTEAILVQDSVAKKRDEDKKAPEYAEAQNLGKEAKDAIDEGDYEKVDKCNKRLREISKINQGAKLEARAKNIRAERATIKETIEQLEKALKKCEEERKQAIELISGSKENLLSTPDKKYLLIIKEQNWVQKTWNKFMNKINGKKRYTENVINVLSKKVRDIEYKSLPALKTKLQTETKPIIEKANKTIANIKHSKMNQEEATLEQKKENKIKETSRLAYNAMISRYRSRNTWTISRLSEQISKQESKTIEKPQLQEIAER